ALPIIWKSKYVDGKVKAALDLMFQAPDKAVVRGVRLREPKLTPRQIAESIRRLTIRVEAPPLLSGQATPEKAKPVAVRVPGRRPRKKPDRPAVPGVRLADLIAAGRLSPPLRLFRRYKKTSLEGTLLPDGSVEFGGQPYPSCSAA